MSAALRLPEPAPLAERIAGALSGPVASDAVAALMLEVTEQLGLISGQLVELETRALDPMTALKDVERGRLDLERLRFDKRRLEVASERLQGRLEAVRGAEEWARREIVYEAARAERDAMVDEVRKVYEPAARKIAAVLDRMRACDARLAALRTDIPRGQTLDGVEATVAPAGTDPYFNTRWPAFSERVRLPGFDGSPIFDGAPVPKSAENGERRWHMRP